MNHAESVDLWDTYRPVFIDHIMDQCSTEELPIYDDGPIRRFLDTNHAMVKRLAQDLDLDYGRHGVDLPEVTRGKLCEAIRDERRATQQAKRNDALFAKFLFDTFSLRV